MVAIGWRLAKQYQQEQTGGKQEQVDQPEQEGEPSWGSLIRRWRSLR
jgi:hypothetical protein